jgi:hypothetical protein
MSFRLTPTQRTPSLEPMHQETHSAILPYGVFCRLKLYNEERIQENAFTRSSVNPIYSLSAEITKEVFGIELSEEFSQICIEIPGSQDSENGKITDQTRFLDVVEGNKEKIREILEFTNTTYKLKRIQDTAADEFWQYHASQIQCLWSNPLSLIEETLNQDPVFLALNSKMTDATKKTWDAKSQCNERANEYKMWPCHFLICMSNPYHR